MVRANGKNKKERKQNRKLCPQTKVCEGLTNPVTLVTAQFWAKQYSMYTVLADITEGGRLSKCHKFPVWNSSACFVSAWSAISWLCPCGTSKTFCCKMSPKTDPETRSRVEALLPLFTSNKKLLENLQNLEKRSVCRQLNVFGGRKRWRPKDGRNHRESFRSTCSPIRTGSPTSRRSRSGLTPRTR